jgi:general L-amino acid transport system permease protein
MTAVATSALKPPAPPPVAARLLQRYFGTPGRAAQTLLLAAFSIWAGWAVFKWAILNATWIAHDRSGCAPGGACWAFVIARIDQFLFGFYPPGERWRPALVLILPVVVFAVAVSARFRRQGQIVGAAILITPIVSLALLSGGFLGLTHIPADRWGGLALTVVIATTSFIASMPLAVLLALARRSDMPVISMLATGFIELWRGLPLVAILFMAVILLPLFMPPGFQVGRVETATIALTIYSAAYLAEVVRGGLQAIPIGQVRAASALGFGYWRTLAYITLPQALGKVLPGVVNSAIALIKDTSYVMIVGLFDFINIVTAALSDPKWLGSPTEAYIFVGGVYWVVCFGLSRWGRSIESRSARARGLAGR